MYFCTTYLALTPAPKQPLSMLKTRNSVELLSHKRYVRNHYICEFGPNMATVAAYSLLAPKTEREAELRGRVSGEDLDLDLDET